MDKEENYCVECGGTGHDTYAPDEEFHQKCPHCKGLGRINKIKIVGNCVEKKRNK